ncbi:MAG: ChbG/HpnK family deacetylase [Planctomycetaceae bacterium]
MDCNAGPWRFIPISAAIAVTIVLGFVAGCGSETKSGPLSADEVSAAKPNGQTQPTGMLVAAHESKSEPFELPPAAAGASPRYLIVHADDAGMCHSVNRATIEAMEKGIVSSVGIMVPCPAFEEFAEYAREHPERDFGVHLTLNAEFKTYRWGPVLSPDEVPSLVNSDGHLWQTEEETVANARADDVERELTAQIDRALQFGVPVSHLDTHMGTVFRRLDFLEIYVNLGMKYNVPILFVRNTRSLASNDFPTAAGFGSRARDVIEALDEDHLPVLDDLFMHYVVDSPRQRQNHYVNVFRRLRPGVQQLIVHCGYRDAELGEITGSYGMRDGDRRFVIDPATAREIERLGIQIIDWKKFRTISSETEKERANPENGSRKERHNS